MKDISRLGFNMFVETNIISPSYGSEFIKERYDKFLKNIEPDIIFQFKSEYFEYGDLIKINNNGHRGPEFINNVDILTAGCSNTYGTGIPDNNTWSDILAINNNKTYNILGYPGGSTYHIINNIFKYFNIFGHPKKIFCVFPDFYRIRTIVDGQFINSQDKNSDPAPLKIHIPVSTRAYTPVNVHNKIINKRKTFIKLPTTPDELFSSEYAAMLNLMQIKLLESYCKSNDIDLIWTIWSKGEKEYFDYASLYFEYYKPLTEDVIDLSYHTKWFPHTSTLDQIISDYPCHLEYENERKEYFHIAKDNNHFGYHWHLHVAEFFQKYL